MHFLLPCFLLLLLPFSTSARPIPTPTPIPNPFTAFGLDSNTTITNPWLNFPKFLNLQKGSNLTGVCELKKYFHHFGYLPPPSSNFSDIFDSSLETALINYQKNLGLPITGQLDSPTINLMMSPRCGLGDSDIRHPNNNHHHHQSPPPFHVTKHYAFFPGRPRWFRRSSPMILTYAISSSDTIDYIPQEIIRSVFSNAFSRWSEVIPVNFTEVEDHETADIKIGFHSGDHGDGEPFDGVLGVLAHAFSPENGRLHLDSAETWAVDFDQEKSRIAVDLESVATHEIGHVLGLAHSSVQDAIMYPSLSPRSKKADLRIDDVEGIQYLYGSNPDFKYSSLLESEERSENSGVGRVTSGSSGWIIFILFGLAHLMLTL